MKSFRIHYAAARTFSSVTIQATDRNEAVKLFNESMEKASWITVWRILEVREIKSA